MLGPIDYLVIGFEGNKFTGEILAELQKVVDAKLVRVFDLLFVTKNEKGEAAVVELQDMPEEVVKAFSPVAQELSGALTEQDAIELAAGLGNNSSAGVLVYEELWAKGVKEALVRANGVLLAEGRIHPEDVNAAMEELKLESKEK